MPIVAEQYAYVIGVDTHARTHTVAVIAAATGAQVAVAGFPVTAAGLARAVDWVARRSADPAGTLAVIEGIGSYGASLARVLTAAGYRVVEADVTAVRARRGRGKSDPLDAAAIGRSVLGVSTDRLRIPRADGPRNALRLLLNARDAMTREKTSTINQLTALLRTCPLDIDARRRLSVAQIRVIAAWRTRPHDPADIDIARSEATRLARRILQLTTDLAANNTRLRAITADLAPDLLALHGVGPVTAAQILVSWSHPGRVRSEAAFAALAGVNPLPASSGNTTRHRLNRGGDRQLNRALHTIAITRARSGHPQTRDYRARRLAEGKTKKEIIRCLKRIIARQIYRQLAATTHPQQLIPTAA